MASNVTVLWLTLLFYRRAQTQLSLRYQNILPVNISYRGSAYFLANDI